MEFKEEMEFKEAMEVEGVNFGRQAMLRAYHVQRAGLKDVQRYLNKIGCADGHHLITNKEIRNSRVSIYLPTDHAQKFQKVWSTATIGIATCRAKVVLFYFDEPDLKTWALEHLPPKVALHDIKSLLIDPFHKTGSYLARYKIKKGMVTIYMYAVKRENRNFNGETALQKLITDIETLNNINDPNLVTKVLEVLFPVISIGLAAVSN